MIRKLLHFLKSVALYFTFAILLIILGGSIYGVDETNTLQCPDYYLDVILFLPFLCVFIVNRWGKITEILKKSIPVKKIDLPPMEPMQAENNSYIEKPSNNTFSSKSDFFPIVEPSKPEAISHLNVLSNIDMMDGHDFEYWAADLLRKLGFYDVSVTPGSGDHGVDVLARKDGIKYAIQCKRYSHDLGNAPVQEVHAGKQMYGCQIGVVLTNKYFTAGAKQLADVNGVLLWDRDWLAERIQETSGSRLQNKRADDDLYKNAVNFVLQNRCASVTAIQRQLKIGYAQAARMIDRMEEEGYIGPFRGSAPREILK